MVNEDPTHEQKTQLHSRLMATSRLSYREDKGHERINTDVPPKIKFFWADYLVGLGAGETDHQRKCKFDYLAKTKSWTEAREWIRKTVQTQANSISKNTVDAQLLARQLADIDTWLSKYPKISEGAPTLGRDLMIMLRTAFESAATKDQHEELLSYLPGAALQTYLNASPTESSRP